MTTRQDNPGALLVDGHVHFHPCFEVGDFLQAAASNFAAARAEKGLAEAVGCLMLTENSWRHDFRAFSEGYIARAAPEWTVNPTQEDCSLLARRDDGEQLVFVAGRQLVTFERLEVLALGTMSEYPDGLPAKEAAAVVASSEALAVMPWGFGKWTGRRGRIVQDMLTSPGAERLFVGDNGGRPGVGLRPPLFSLAERRNIPILRGSDPLPLPAEVAKPGRFGFVLENSADLESPAAAIKRALRTRIQPEGYGRLEHLTTFARRQIGLRLRKQPPRPPSMHGRRA
ncbi:MAG: hypothetical protein HKN72_11705 [Gemmatimonadetes bacterium]|nr:hypothetical protein [Gemmatimonadota bacterium]